MSDFGKKPKEFGADNSLRKHYSIRSTDAANAFLEIALDRTNSESYLLMSAA
jgi:hypothetical protein